MKKRLVVGAGLVIVLGLAGARLAFGATGPFGRDYHTGYLTGRRATGIGWIAVPTKNVRYFGLGNNCEFDRCTVTLASFLANYHDRLNDASSLVDRGRAAATIDVMLNRQGTSFGTVQRGIDYAVAHYSEWADLVTGYANSPVSSGYYVDWNANVDFTNFHRNAMGLNDARSSINGCDAGQKCYPDITFIDDLHDPVFNHAVVFHAPGGFRFFIKHKCGNLTGDTRGLPNWKLTATSSVTPTTVHPLDTVTFVHAIRNSAGSDTATFNYTVKYKFPASGVYRNRATVSSVTLAGGGTKRVNDPAGAPLRIPLGARDGDKYCEYISFTNANGPGTGFGTSSPVCVTVAVLSTPTCGSAQPSKDGIDPVTVFDVKATVDYPIGGATAAKAAGDKLYMQVTGPTYDYGPKNAVPAVSGNSLIHTFTGVGPTNKTGTFTIDYGVKDSGGIVLLSCSQTFVIANEPYFVVNGGDVEAGAAMTVGGACLATGPTGADNQASVVSWSQENAAYDGAGTQYAAMALGYLQDFATAQGSGLAPSGLSFANSVNVSSPFGSGEDTYGGGFDSEPCVPDYTNGLSGPQTGPVVAPPPSSPQTTVYVNGDVFVNSNISIYNGAYASAGAIPSYMVVASGGNIYIAPGVTRLDGLYVAEPDSLGNGGNIYTCSTVPTAGLKGGDTNLSLSLSTYYNTCKKKLVVNGSFVAKQIWLLRTGGTLYDNATGPAETFNFSPELWLNAPNASTSGSAAGADDSITSLPPIL